MAEYDDREHFIPMRKSDLLDLLLRDPAIANSSAEKESLKRLHTLTGAVFHFEYLHQLEHLKDMYAPFDPDNEMLEPKPLNPAERVTHLDELFKGVGHLLEKANFTKLTEEEFNLLSKGSSDLGLEMDVDTNIFERWEVWVRGDKPETRQVKHKIFFWKMIDKEVPLFKRAILICKLKPGHPRLSKLADTEDVYIKIVKDIAKPDIEMVVPGGKVIMPLFQKILLYGSMIGGGGYLLYTIINKLVNSDANISGASVAGAMVLLLAPLAALGGFAFKQYSAYNVAKQKFTLQISESQYFQTIDNNLGAITRVLDEAEEQECREVLLGYYFLWKYAPQGMTEKTLDDTIEKYIEEKTGLKVDFEIGDSLEKLVRLNMARQQGDVYFAEPIEKALEALDYRWDNYFSYNQGD